VTTVFGPDISSYQSGLILSRLAQASFVIAKTTEGTYYTDADYQGWRAQAAQLRKPFLWYHFLSDEDAAKQAAHTAANVGDPALPGMLDTEPEGKFSPSLKQIINYIDAAHAKGLNLRLVYLPRWYWEQIGSPDLSEISSRGVSLVSSQYPGGTGSPSRIYPGDGAAGWESYGGMVPLIYQFTNQASDGGQPLDYNAFRGTTARLVAVLTNTTTPGADVQLTDQITLPPFAVKDFPDFGFNSTTIEVADLLAWTAVRASHTVNRMPVIEDKLDQLLARPAAPTADEIGVAVAAHLSGGGGASPADIATAVEHLFAQKLSA
jgi:hypothetical protein